MPISVPLHVPVHLLVPVPVHVLVLVPVTVHVHVLVPVTRERKRERESERVRNFIREIGDPLSGEREIRVFVQRLNHKISDFFSFYGRHGNYFFSVGTCHNNRNMFRVRHFGITSTD